MPHTPPIVIIGVGNDSRRDDGAGLLFVRRLRKQMQHSDDVLLLESDGDPATLLDAWTGAGLAIVVDASRSGAAPGTLVELDASTVSIGLGLRHSSHTMGVAEAARLGAVLGRMPDRIRIFAIEGEEFGFGEGVGSAVDETVTRLVEHIRDEARRSGNRNGPDQ